MTGRSFLLHKRPRLCLFPTCYCAQVPLPQKSVSMSKLVGIRAGQPRAEGHRLLSFSSRVDLERQDAVVKNGEEGRPPETAF